MCGALLVTLGCATGGHLSWQVWGTTWVSERQHAEAVRDLERAWADGRSSTSTDDVTATAVLRVPRFGSSWEVPVVQGVGEEQLSAGVGHFPGTAGPGEPGNFALAGHRVTHGEPFRDLPELVAGDEVLVETRDAGYHYRLVTDGDALSVSFEEHWVVAAEPRNPRPAGVQPPGGPDRLLTLTTCAELFHTDERLVVFGVLESVQRPG